MPKQSPRDPVRAVTEKILDRITADAAFRRQVVANPEKALAAAGFDAELQKLRSSTSAQAKKCKPAVTCVKITCNATCKAVTCGKQAVTDVIKK
jgi:hypothetical protein